jgi:tetratricopeptide (TPR) repeat protein
MRNRTLALLIAIFAGAVFLDSGAAQSVQAPGLADVGIVSFANSGSAAAQPYFLRGLALLHDFEYDDAAANFRKAQEIDPGFAIAYWGEAMTYNHPLWAQQDAEAGRAVLNRLAPNAQARETKAATERERDYLRAVEVLYGPGTKEGRDFRYCDAMAALHQKYPDDVDAATFYALSLMGTSHEGRDIPTYMRALAILEDLFYAYPNHPGVAHYLIHATDDPVHAPLGLRAAERYSKIAASAAHAQHMTSHIFIAMGMWDDVVRANEIATNLVNTQNAAKNKPPVYCGHYSYWLDYGYMQQGRMRDALTALNNCAQSAGQAPGAKIALDPASSLLSSYAVMRTRYLIDTEDWNGDVAKEKFPEKGDAAARLTFDFGTGYADVHRGDLTAARATLADLQIAHQKLKASPSNYASEVQRENILDQELQAMIEAADGKLPQAIESVRKLANTETAMPFEFGPPFVDLPSEELLGDLLLKAGKPADARAAFQSALQRTPDRTNCLTGLARAERASGDIEGANKTEAKLKQIWHLADHASTAGN